MVPNLSTRKRSLRGGAAILTAAMAVGLVACSDASASTGGDEDRDISISIVSAPRSLDPAQLDGGTQSYVWSSVYDTLLHLDNAGELQPNAAESWEYGADNTELTLRLREGMTFSSGAPVDAEAVVSTLERNRTTPGQQQSKLANVESIAAEDERTVVIKLSSADASLLPNLALDLGVIGDPATIDDDRTATDPVGSGPYVLDADASVSGSSYVFDRRDDYWNVESYPFARLTVRVLQDQTASINALRSGEVDVATVPTNQIESLGNPELDVNEIEVQSVLYLNLADRDGTSLAPLGDVRVRQAINHAFDREAMVEQLLFGNGRATAQEFSPNGPAYSPDREDAYAYDPERARALLAEAGYADGFDVTMPSTPISQSFEPTLSQFLGDIGIDVTWNPVPAQNVTASVISREYPMYLFVLGSEPIAPREVQRQLHSASQNPFEWSSPELEQLEVAASSAIEQDAQDAAYRALGEYVTDQALFAPIAYLGTNIVTSPDVEFLGDGSNVFPSIRTFDAVE